MDSDIVNSGRKRVMVHPTSIFSSVQEITTWLCKWTPLLYSLLSALDGGWWIVFLLTIWKCSGHGRDSCPGRHYAVTEIKILLAYLLLNYDVKLRPGTKRPKCVFYNKTVGLDRSAELLIRKRQVKWSGEGSKGWLGVIKGCRRDDVKVRWCLDPWSIANRSSDAPTSDMQYSISTLHPISTSMSYLIGYTSPDTPARDQQRLPRIGSVFDTLSKGNLVRISVFGFIFFQSE